VVPGHGVEPRSPRFQRGALPLGEPDLVSLRGFEPRLREPKSRVLPLDDREWFGEEDSDLQPPGSEPGVLPIELPPRVWVDVTESNRYPRRHNPVL
jgi:hypothetical protein